MESRSRNFITHQTFFSTVQTGDVEGLRLWLHKVNGEDSSDELLVSPFVSLQNDTGKTALYIAAESDLKDMFRYLFKFCDLKILTIRSNLDMNAFHVAAKLGHHEIVKEILKTYPEICKYCDATNTSPLYAAAVQGHLDVVNAILSADVTSARTVRKNGKTPLHAVSRNGLLPIVKALIDADPAVVSIKDRKGQTAVHMAAKGKCALTVEELLLADYSTLNHRDKKGNIPLHYATRKCRPGTVNLLLSHTSLEINAVNNQRETAMDLAYGLQYSEAAVVIREALADAGACSARRVDGSYPPSDLKRAVSDIKHEVHSQIIQNEKTRRRVSGVAKELEKLHRQAVQNTTNSVTVVAVLFASIGFISIFNLPGQYVTTLRRDAGTANIADEAAFRLFFLLNATSLFVSLAVVVVQITLVAWETTAQKRVVSVVNKLMWIACVSTCGAFVSMAYVVAGRKASWLALTVTLVGVPILFATLFGMCCLAFWQRLRGFGNDDSGRRIRRPSGCKSFSWSFSVDASDLDGEDNRALNRDKLYIL